MPYAYEKLIFVNSKKTINREKFFLKNVNTELSQNPAIPLLCVYLGEFNTYVHLKPYIQMFIAALST